MNADRDLSLRAMTDDGSLRVIVVDVTETVRETARAQGASAAEAKWLGDLIAGTVMIRETMSPDLRVQGILQISAGAFVADSHPDGGSRGLIQRGSKVSSVDGARLQMMRTLPRGSVQQGIVRVDERVGVSDALMRYLQHSEQVESALAVSTLVQDGEVVAAGGYLIQLLPELDDATLALVTARLQGFPTMEALQGSAATVDGVMAMLLEHLPFTELARGPLRFQCRCDRTRLIQALATVGRDELEAMIAEAKPLEIGCDYCNAQYSIDVSELLPLLQPN